LVELAVVLFFLVDILGLLLEPSTNGGRQLLWDSRSYQAQTMRCNKSSRTKTRTQNQRQPKVPFSTVDFSKVDPLYKCRTVSFYREASGLFTFRGCPRMKRIETEDARLFLGGLQLGLHVIGAS
jgi:hypothetical protein